MRKKILRKKILIGVVPLVAVLGLWLGLGIALARPYVAVHARPAVVHANVAHANATGKVSRSSEDPSGTDTDNVQSGDQTTPDTAKAAVHRASEDPSGTEGESEGESTTPETDNVDCQQDGNFEGVNTAGTGPGCDGSGT